MSEEEDEEYIACSNCGEVVPKNYDFCPHCGRKLFRPHMTPLLLISGGLYFFNAVLLGILFYPHLLFVTALELMTAFFLIFGVKFAASLGLMLSVLNVIFLTYLLMRFQNPIAMITLIFTHIIGACLIIHEWEKLT